MEDQAAIVSLLIEKLAIERIHLVVHSMGGAIGLLLSEKIRAKTQTFISLEGNLLGESESASRKIEKVSFDEFKEKTLKDLIETLAASSRPGWQLWANWLKEENPEILYKNARSLSPLSFSGELMMRFIALKAKKVYVYGEDSYQQKEKTIQKLQSGNIATIAISGSGHFMMIDNPKELYQKLFDIVKA